MLLKAQGETNTSKLFADFFSLSLDFTDSTFFWVIINIIIFFNVLVGTYEKRKSYEMVEKWVFIGTLSI
jgi:cytochrome c oxidase subunit 3